MGWQSQISVADFIPSSFMLSSSASFSRMLQRRKIARAPLLVSSSRLADTETLALSALRNTQTPGCRFFDNVEKNLQATCHLSSGRMERRILMRGLYYRYCLVIFSSLASFPHFSQIAIAFTPRER